jgi:hypothetical protein
LADRPALCHRIQQAQRLGSVTQMSVLQPIAFYGWRAKAVTSDGQDPLVQNMHIAHGNLCRRPNEQELIGVARQRLASAARVADPVTPETPNKFNVGQTCIRRRAIIQHAPCRYRAVTLPYAIFSDTRTPNKASADLKCRTLLIQAIARSVTAQEQELI